MNERIKALRKELKMSQDVFAEKLGLTKNYISLVENGNRNLSEQSIKVLCSIPKSKEQLFSELLGEAVKADENDFKRRLFLALSKLDDSGWENLEKLIDSIAKKEE